MENPFAQPEVGSTTNDVAVAAGPPDLTLGHASRLAVLASQQISSIGPEPSRRTATWVSTTILGRSTPFATPSRSDPDPRAASGGLPPEAGTASLVVRQEGRRCNRVGLIRRVGAQEAVSGGGYGTAGGSGACSLLKWPCRDVVGRRGPRPAGVARASGRTRPTCWREDAQVTSPTSTRTGSSRRRHGPSAPLGGVERRPGVRGHPRQRARRRRVLWRPSTGATSQRLGTATP